MLEYVDAAEPFGVMDADDLRDRSPEDAARFTDGHLAIVHHSGGFDGAAVIGTREELTAHYRRVLAFLEREVDTWTFCGHWEGSRIVVDYVLPGRVEDRREDGSGQFPDGLWAAVASAPTVEEAQAAAVAEYEAAYAEDRERGVGQ